MSIEEHRRDLAALKARLNATAIYAEEMRQLILSANVIPGYDNPNRAIPMNAREIGTAFGEIVRRIRAEL